jgi:hypothetical protein
MLEVVALVSSGVALVVSVAAIALDLRIIRDQGEHHGLLKDLHHHHIVKPQLERVVAIDDGPSKEPGHEDCHGPVYTSKFPAPCEKYCKHVPDGYMCKSCWAKTITP